MRPVFENMVSTTANVRRVLDFRGWTRAGGSGFGVGGLQPRTCRNCSSADRVLWHILSSLVQHAHIRVHRELAPTFYVRRSLWECLACKRYRAVTDALDDRSCVRRRMALRNAEKVDHLPPPAECENPKYLDPQLRIGLCDYIGGRCLVGVQSDPNSAPPIFNPCWQPWLKEAPAPAGQRR